MAITYRLIKGAPLTNAEIDGNYTYIEEVLDTKLNSSDFTGAEILSRISDVDGALSGLDADKLDGKHSATTNTPDTVVVRDGSGNFAAGTITAELNGNAATVTNGVYTTSSFYVGTTQISASRSSASQTLTGINIDGNAATVTNGVYTSGSYSNPSWLTGLAGEKVTSIPNASLTNSSITINGNSVSLGGSIDVTSVANTWTTQQTFRDTLFSITDDSDTSKVLRFQVSAVATGTTRTITIPDESGTIATREYIQTSTRNSQGTKTISTSAPTGGNSGDIWYRV